MVTIRDELTQSTIALSKVTGLRAPPMPSAAKKAICPASQAHYLTYRHLTSPCMVATRKKETTACLKEKVGRVTFLGAINMGIER